MKTFYLLIGFLLTSTLTASAQYIEVSAQLTSSLFSFQGNNVVHQSFFNISRELPPPKVGSASYTNDPWSNRSSFSWGVTMQAQRVAKTNWITGLQLAYESLATQTSIIGGSDLGRFISFQQGHSTFTYEYITLHPFLGHRFGNRQVSLDLTAGLDMSFNLRTWEKGQGTTPTNELYVTYHKHAMPDLDMRPRLNATAYFHRVGLSASYAHGMTNYGANLVGQSPTATTSQVWRLSAIYRFTN